MKPLRCPWRVFSAVFVCPAALFSALLVVAAILERASYIYIDRVALYLSFALQGGVWYVLSLIFFLLSKSNAQRLRRLKRGGLKYEGSVEALHPIYGVRLLHYLTFRADCSYINAENKRCLVRSRAALSRFHGAEDIAAFVYVNRSEPRDYAVELFERTREPAGADYDYR